MWNTGCLFQHCVDANAKSACSRWFDWASFVGVPHLSSSLETLDTAPANVLTCSRLPGCEGTPKNILLTKQKMRTRRPGRAMASFVSSHHADSTHTPIARDETLLRRETVQCWHPPGGQVAVAHTHTRRRNPSKRKTSDLETKIDAGEMSAQRRLDVDRTPLRAKPA